MLYELELAGCLTEQIYEKNIPEECSMTTMEQHTNAMLCWGLVSALEKGHKMDCSGCDWNKVNFEAAEVRIAARKAARKAAQNDPKAS